MQEFLIPKISNSNINNSTALIEKTTRLMSGAIDMHCHGVGKFDFTEISTLKLSEIEAILAIRNHQSILTLYLPEESFADFLILMRKFYEGKIQGLYPHISGIALEGPLLGSHGGTPKRGVWLPTKTQWKQIAACGKYGLIYAILSPDAIFVKNSSQYPNSVCSVSEILLDGDVLPTPGHFFKHDPIHSAQCLQDLFDLVKQWGIKPTITDHLFNDMPRNFKHAWRTPEEKTNRSRELSEIHLENWSLESLETSLGIVPTTIIRNAIAGHVKICQNFDGEHVDLAIVKKTVELVGPQNILLMTDSIESKRLAGRELTLKPGSSLLYQDEDIVAAGTQGVFKQIMNMISIGLTDSQIQLITKITPMKLLPFTQVAWHPPVYQENHAEAVYI